MNNSIENNNRHHGYHCRSLSILGLNMYYVHSLSEGSYRTLALSKAVYISKYQNSGNCTLMVHVPI